MQRFTDLAVWRLAHQITLDVYRLSAAFPADERHALTSQLRRAASSVPANIAEGSKRRTRGDYGRFLNVGEGSLAETEYFLILARDLGYASPTAIEGLLAKVASAAGMLHALRLRVEQG